MILGWGLGENLRKCVPKLRKSEPQPTFSGSYKKREYACLVVPIEICMFVCVCSLGEIFENVFGWKQRFVCSWRRWMASKTIEQGNTPLPSNIDNREAPKLQLEPTLEHSFPKVKNRINLVFLTQGSACKFAFRTLHSLYLLKETVTSINHNRHRHRGWLNDQSQLINFLILGWIWRIPTVPGNFCYLIGKKEVSRKWLNFWPLIKFLPTKIFKPFVFYCYYWRVTKISTD